MASSENGGHAAETEEAVEIMRQLRAARDGRFNENAAGRYVIDGEARPQRKVREKLMYRQWITWRFRPTKGIEITPDGEIALGLMEAVDGC